MRRRELLAGAAALSVAPRCGIARPLRLLDGRPPSVGHVAVGSRRGGDDIAVLGFRRFEQALREFGYVPGQTIALSPRAAMPDQESIRRVLSQLAGTIDLLVIWSSAGATTAKRMDLDLPIVFVSVGEAVTLDLVETLARPGGSMTGITFEASTDTYAKRLEILREIAPGLKRVAVLAGAEDVNIGFALPSLRQAATRAGLALEPIQFRREDDLGAIFDTLRAGEVTGAIVVAGALTYAAGGRIADLGRQTGIAVIHPFREDVVAGGLVSYGPDLIAMAGQAARFVDAILKGADPAVLPVEQPVRYQFGLNVKTAGALGLAVSSALLARADEVIE